jgi:hypothetical protein
MSRIGKVRISIFSGPVRTAARQVVGTFADAWLDRSGTAVWLARTSLTMRLTSSLLTDGMMFVGLVGIS